MKGTTPVTKDVIEDSQSGAIPVDAEDTEEQAAPSLSKLRRALNIGPEHRQVAYIATGFTGPEYSVSPDGIGVVRRQPQPRG